MKEIWRDIISFNGDYQISTIGIVKSLKYGKERIMKLKTCKDGYLHVSLSINGKRKTYSVHQLMAITFLNHIPCGNTVVVNHKNFIRNDNKLSNLEVIPNRDNTDKKHIKSSSQYTGVSWDIGNSKWVSYIFINGKRHHLGSYSTESQASEKHEYVLEDFSRIVEFVQNTTSKYKGVYYNKKSSMWIARFQVNGKRKYLGTFNTEQEANLEYQVEKLKYYGDKRPITITNRFDYKLD